MAGEVRPADEIAELVRSDPGAAVQLLVESAGNDTTAKALRDAGAALGQVIDGVVGLINPEAVVLGGYLGTLGEHLLPTIGESLSRRLELAAYADTSIVALDPVVPRSVNGAILAARDACFYDPLTLTRPVS